MSSKRYFLNITGFTRHPGDDRLEITEAECERAKEGKPILWVDGSAFHVWPSMNKGKEHICGFEVDKLEKWKKKRSGL